MDRQRGFVGAFERFHVQARPLRRLSLWARFVAQFKRWRQLAKERRDLAMLSSDLQKDLGLSRADIMMESERPFWDDPLGK